MFDLIRKRCEEGRLYLVINRERVLLEEMNLIRMDAKLPIPTKGNNPVCNLRYNEEKGVDIRNE